MADSESTTIPPELPHDEAKAFAHAVRRIDYNLCAKWSSVTRTYGVRSEQTSCGRRSACSSASSARPASRRTDMVTPGVPIGTPGIVADPICDGRHGRTSHPAGEALNKITFL
jgi:hypothetical protein